MLHIIWTIIVVLFVFWLLGLVLHIGGSLIHLLLVIALILVVYNLIMHSRSRNV
ncbi:MAG: lmo0937 family membrane protein [Ktedonobacteraceae bacterium]